MFSIFMTNQREICFCLPGLDRRTGGALSLQHTLLLPGAGQRGGGGGGSDVTRGANRLTTGGCKQQNP